MIVRAVAALMLLLISPIAPAPPRDPGTLARKILSDTSRYHLTQPQVPRRPKNWIERAWDWVALQWTRLMGSLLGNLRVSPKASAALGSALLLLLTVIFLGAIAKLLMFVTRGKTARGSIAAMGPEPSVREFYQRSVEAAERGALTQAFELLFAAAIEMLVRRGLTLQVGSATVGDFRREVRARDASLLSPFDAIAGPFTSAVYAQRTPNAADWAQARDAFLTLWIDRDAA